MDNSKQVETLIRELDKQREAYMETFQKVNELLAKNLAATASAIAAKDTTSGASPHPPSEKSRQRSTSRATSEQDSHVRKTSTGLSTFITSSESKATGEDSDDEDQDEALYVQTPLESQSYDEEGLRNHLRSYKWNDYGKKILEGVAGNPRLLSQSSLIPDRKGPMPDRSHYSHYQVFAVGPDGSPLPIERPVIEQESGRAMAIWQAIKEINPPSRERKAVGRITTIREPSPILFGAVHHVMDNAFNVDELFRYLADAGASSASMHRAFDDDVRQRRSFIFNFEYFTLIGKDCQPMKWQLADRQENRKPDHIAITRCSSVIALVLNGDQIRKLKNPARRATKEYGFVYDTFSSWQVLNLQCYPDWKASLDVHDSTKHYVNGPDAFLNTLLGEFRDALRRFDDIYKAISRRVTPPLEFMFDSEIRDAMLFEDDEYTMAKRYFWAHQTLGIMNESIKAMVDAYEDNFTDDVWEGKHKTLWPLPDQNSSKSAYFKRKMASLKKQFETETQKLRNMIDENEARRKEIIGLREELFTGTSIQESRKSVMATETTVQQGHNIKILTLVSIFFLPLTFVTSVFGMTNMPTDRHYWMFGIVTATVCVPFLILIGSLNSHRGMNFWRRRTKVAFDNIGAFFKWLASRRRREPGLIAAKIFDSQSSGVRPLPHARTASSDGIQMRARRWSTNRKEGRTSEVEDPTSRDDQQKNLENGLASLPSGPGSRPRLPSPPPSRLAEMWKHERKRTLSYSTDL